MLKKFIDIVFGVALVFQSVVLLDYLLDLIPIFYETVFNIQRSLYLGIKFVLLKALHFLAPVFQLLNLAFQFLRLWVLTCLQYFGIALNFVYKLFLYAGQAICKWGLTLIKPLLNYLASKPVFVSIYQFLTSISVNVPTVWVGLMFIAISLGVISVDRELLSSVSLSLLTISAVMICKPIVIALAVHVIPVVGLAFLVCGGLVATCLSLFSFYSRASYCLHTLMKNPSKVLKDIKVVSWLKWILTSALLVKMTSFLLVGSVFSNGYTILWSFMNIFSCLSVMLTDLLWMSSRYQMRGFYEDLTVRLGLFFVVAKASMYGAMPVFCALNLVHIAQFVKECHLFDDEILIKSSDIARRFTGTDKVEAEREQGLSTNVVPW